MAGKIPIRRIGAILPTLCLVGVVVFLTVLLWLSRIGLPDAALRKAESLAAENGVSLHVKAIRLAPANGLAVRLDGVQLEQALPDAAPATAEVRKIIVVFSLAKCLEGHYLPARIEIPEADVTLPLEENTDAIPLKLDNLCARVLCTEQDEEARLSLRGRLNGIELTLMGRIPLPPISGAAPEPEAEETTPADIENTVGEVLPTLRRVRDEIARQQWTEAESPRLDARLDLTGETPHIIGKAEIPRWEQAPFCFRDITLDAVLRNNTLIINKGGFRTEAPDAVVNLQGGYDLTKREADFNISSTAAVINMVQKLVDEQDIPELVRQVHIEPEHAPHIELSAHADLTENNELENIRLEGDIHQDGLMFGKTEVCETSISFYFDNGDLNIDKLAFRLPDGGISASALLRDGKGQAHLKLDIPTPTLLQLAQDAQLLSAEECARIGLSGDNTLDLTAVFCAPVFVPGKTRFEELVPTLRGVNAHLGLEKVTQDGLTLVTPRLDIALEGVEHDTEQAQAATLTLSLTLPHAEYAQGDMRCEEKDGSLTLTVNDLHVDGGRFRAQAADLKAALKSHRASIGEQHASADGMELTAQLSALDIPFSGDTAPTIGTADLGFRCDASAMEEQKIEGLRLTVSDLRGLVLSGKADALPQGGTLHAELAALECGDKLRATETDAAVSLREDGATNLKFNGYLNDKPWECHATLRLREEGRTLIAEEGHIFLPAAQLESLLADAGFTIPELKIPEEAELNLRDAELELSPFNLRHASVSLRVPELTRCPQLPVLKGQDITIGVETDLDLRTDAQGHILYTGTAHVTHETGELNATLDGDLSSSVRVRGTNTIHADVIDRLIDDPDAHYIMRDFIFTRGVTKILADNIDTIVDYSNGITVLSHCDADIRDMDYMLLSMEDEEDAEGNIIREKVRTDLGTDYPYSRVFHATCGVDVEVRMLRKDAEGKDIPDVIRIDLTHPELHYDNRPWFKRQGIKGGQTETVVRGRNVCLDIENSVVILEDIEGECYPAYAFGMFYPDLQIFLKDIIITRPAQASAAYLAFPIADDCKQPMGGTIRALCKSGASFRFLGTDIPLDDFSGFVTISDTDVYLSRMNALTWQGVVNADVRIGFAGGKTSFDGYVTANNLNLSDIAAAYDTKLSPANCRADIRFTSPSADVNDLRAYGSFSLTDGNLMELQLFNPVGDLISDLPNYLVKFESAVSPRGEEYKPNWVLRTVGKLFSATGNTVGYVGDKVTGTAAKMPLFNHLLRYDIQQAYADFSISRGHLTTRLAKAKGYNLSVRMNLDLALDDLSLNGNLWPQISSVPTILLAPLTFLSDHVIDIIIYGSATDIQWRFGLDRKDNSRAGVRDSVNAEEEKHR